MLSVYSTINSLELSKPSVERLNHTLFLQACRFSMVGGFTFWLVVVSMSLPHILWICCLLPAVTSAFLYFKMRHRLFLASGIFYAVHILGLGVGYFFNGGSHGTVLYILFVLVCIILFLLPHRQLEFTGLTALIVCGMIWGEYYLGDTLSRPHHSNSLRLVDIAVAWTSSMIMCSWIIVFARKAYESERKKTEQADLAKSKFLATMSHEIRTPLNAIVGLNALALERAQQDPQLHSHLETVAHSAEHLLLVINDILDFSKIEAGEMELDKSRFSLDDLIAYLSRTFKVICEQRGIDFKLKYEPDGGVWLVGDPQRLRQILYNLLSNAVKFTSKGSVSIEISRIAIAPLKERLLFMVKDTGVGIPPDRLPGLFQDYQQASSDISSKFGGTGLGLAISKRLVQMMKGKIWVNSIEGKGSEFYFEVELTVDESYAPVPMSRAPIRELLPGLRILVAEDNRVNQKLMGLLLKKVHARFEIVSNGEEALQLLSEKVFDLVLMDIEMPILDGFKATEALRQGRAGVLNQFIPVVALTAHAIVEMRRKGEEMGMSHYLTKPLRPQDLYDLLAEIQHSQDDSIH